MTDLEKRKLGRTGLDVTILGYGAMELRGAPRGPELSDEEAERVLNGVLDAGINFIDTSIDYGRSEERIGRFIGHRRSEYYLASKCGCVVGGAQGEHVHTAANVRHGIENSLRLLKTDYLDLVQFHRSLTLQEFEAEGALQEVLKLKAEGKVRFVGVSGVLPNLDEQIDSGVFDAFQITYSALQREHEDVISRAAKAGAGTIIRGGVARGTPDDWQRTYYMVPSQTLQDRWQQANLDELLDGSTRLDFTLRYTLSHPGLHTTIVGTRNLEHLQANVRAAKLGPLSGHLGRGKAPPHANGEQRCLVAVLAAHEGSAALSRAALREVARARLLRPLGGYRVARREPQERVLRNCTQASCSKSRRSVRTETARSVGHSSR